MLTEEHSFGPSVQSQRKDTHLGQALVAHSYNPSFSEGRDQEDWGLKPAQANSFMRSYLEKNPSQKRACGMAQAVGPEFKSKYHKTTKKDAHLDAVCLFLETSTILMTAVCFWILFCPTGFFGSHQRVSTFSL
jgi:hypothetical protein